MAAARKEKIAVLGGGVGALSAAFYLTEEPGWADRYEITVYQQGWRLGGKCASGHDLRPGYGHRIYEHGLHIFAGFYDQAFDCLTRAYAALERPKSHPNRTVWDAFTPQDTIALVDRSQPAARDPIWCLDFSPNDKRPGDDLTVPPVLELLQKMVSFVINGAPDRAQTLRVSHTDDWDWEDDITPGNCIPRLMHFIHMEADKVEEAVVDAVLVAVGRMLAAMLEARMASISASTYKSWDAATQLSADRFLLAIFLAETIIHGVLADNVIKRGFDAIDTEEWTEWIERHAEAVAKTQSPHWGDPKTRAKHLVEWTALASVYDYVFGFGDGGDPSKPTYAAGTALRAGLLMISYKGHFFWKMRGAMGDVVIAPLYLALKKRGVKFEFFTRVTELHVDTADFRVERIDYVRQARLRDPERGYQPLIDVPIPGWPEDQPLEGWPAEPLWDQLDDGQALHEAGRDFEGDHRQAPGAGDVPGQLRFGEHFDKVILGISLGALKQVCASFPERLPGSKWGPLFDKVTLTRTCAMQLWLTRTVEDLGFRSPDRTVSGADQPYSSWADMAHLLARETWKGDHRPLSVLYFCGQIQGSEDSGKANAAARKLAVQWLKDGSELYWPCATSDASPYSLDPGLLFDPEPGSPGDPLDRQFIRANCNPSDLYVQSPKNSVYARMDADESGLWNLFLAGDWTRNGVNAGCAEAAARSGARCAAAILGRLESLPL
jgi:uncharacterized protein with NAD-binding domain and iron-sulfur cluster